MIRNKYLTYFLCLIPVLFITLINRYPILYSDTSTYLASGFELETPADRPITYGIFLRIFSFNGLTLFLVPFFQGLLFLYILKDFLRLFVAEKNAPVATLGLSVMIGVFSGYYWSVNQLIPDFLTAIGFLALFIIAITEFSLSKQVFNYFVFFLAAASHISNVFIYFLIAIVLFFVAIKMHAASFKKIKFKFASIFLLLVISYLIMGSAISKSKDVFYCGSLAEKGILQQILNDKCSDKKFKLCDYKDSIPLSFDYFVWNEDSPLYSLGGWKSLKSELNEISIVSRSESVYVKAQISATFLLLVKQFSMIKIAEGNGSFDSQTMLGKRIVEYTNDQNRYQNSLQAQNAFTHQLLINTWYDIAGLVNFVAFMILSIVRFRHFSGKLKLFTLLSCFLMICTALIVAYSSVISHRHGVKLSWLLVLANFLICLEWFQVARSTKNCSQKQ